MGFLFFPGRARGCQQHPPPFACTVAPTPAHGEGRALSFRTAILGRKRACSRHNQSWAEQHPSGSGPRSSGGTLWVSGAAVGAIHGGALLGAGGGCTSKQGTRVSPALQGAWGRGEEDSGSQLALHILPSRRLVRPGRSEKTLSRLSAPETSSAERLRRLWARSTFLFNIHLAIYFARKGRGGEIAFLGELRAGLAALSEPQQRSRARGRRGGSGGSAVTAVCVPWSGARKVVSSQAFPPRCLRLSSAKSPGLEAVRGQGLAASLLRDGSRL